MDFSCFLCFCTGNLANVVWSGFCLNHHRWFCPPQLWLLTSSSPSVLASTATGIMGMCCSFWFSERVCITLSGFKGLQPHLGLLPVGIKPGIGRIAISLLGRVAISLEGLRVTQHRIKHLLLDLRGGYFAMPYYGYASIIMAWVSASILAKSHSSSKGSDPFSGLHGN